MKVFHKFRIVPKNAHVMTLEENRARIFRIVAGGCAGFTATLFLSAVVCLDASTHIQPASMNTIIAILAVFIFMGALVGATYMAADYEEKLKDKHQVDTIIEYGRYRPKG